MAETTANIGFEKQIWDAACSIRLQLKDKLPTMSEEDQISLLASD